MSATDPAPLPRLYFVYRVLARMGAGLLHRGARNKLRKNGLPTERQNERAGFASQTRPIGRLVWVHAVSVGETLSILDVLGEMRAQDPRLTILLTTTTTTAAEIARDRMPEGCIHQFSPLDTPQAVARFLDHWQPDLISFVESEVWPTQITMASRRDIPMALINARLSQASLAAWGKRKSLASALFGRFSLILCQTDAVRDGLRGFVDQPWQVVTSGDLKKSSDPLPVNDIEVAGLSKAIGARPFWLASSTHKGEEEQISAAHKGFIQTHQKGLLILLPRHPERGDEIEELLGNDGWRVARRSRGEAIAPDTQVYLADTLGETGLFYRLSELVFVGGSFVDVGGHNPYEPAHFGCAILHGPQYANFAQGYGDMGDQDACIEVADGAELGAMVASLWGDDEAELLKVNAKFYIENGQNIRKDIAGHLLNLIPRK